jgi:hypothetical protein
MPKCHHVPPPITTIKKRKRKIIPVETIPVFQEWAGVKKNGGGGGNLSIIYLIHCKNFCKCHNVPTPSTIKK